MSINDVTYLKNCLPVASTPVVIEGWSRSKAYNVRSRLNKIFNPHDKFVELKYDEATKTATFSLES